MNPNALQPYTANPRYWQFNGKPVRLLGGSIEDNSGEKLWKLVLRSFASEIHKLLYYTYLILYYKFV